MYMYRNLNRLIICEHIGLNNPTIVYHNNKKLITQGLSIDQLVSRWRTEFHLTGWITLALENRLYNALKQSTLTTIKSVEELFYENQVVCIDKDLLKEFNVGVK